MKKNIPDPMPPSMCEGIVERLTDFAFVQRYTDKGRMLVIIGKEYHAWHYDTYIFEAIDLVKNWRPKQITYDRIIHLRTWIRENSQHSHNLYFRHLRSMRSVKLWLDELIEREFGSDEYWVEQKKFELEKNKEIFSKSR